MLAGKSALVTGSSQGIGLGVAQAFAASGAKVVVTSEKPLAKCPEVQRLLSDYAHTLSFWWSSTGLDYFRGYLTNLRRTTRADLSRYITTYIQGKPHVGLALLSEESQKQVQLTPEELIGQ